MQECKLALDVGARTSPSAGRHTSGAAGSRHGWLGSMLCLLAACCACWQHAVPAGLTPITQGALCSAGQYDRPAGQLSSRGASRETLTAGLAHAGNQASNAGAARKQAAAPTSRATLQAGGPSTLIKHPGVDRAHCSSRGTGRSAARRPRKFARQTGPTQLSPVAARWVRR